MNTLLTLTRREIAERRPMLWGTLAAALIPLLPRLQPWLRPELRREWHEGLAFVFGATFPFALAIGLGASVIGEDLAQRRLGFYFSRPLSGWTVWASKNLAAILITLGTGAAFVLPVALLSDEGPSAVIGDLARKFPEWLLPWIAILLGLIFVTQAVAGAYRARDGLFALDIAVLAALVSLGAALVWELRAAGVVFFSPEVGPSTLENAVGPAMLFVAAAAAVAAAMQVIVGRTDARRGHLALSTTLWGTLTVGLLGAAGFTSWVLAVTPQDVGAYPWSVRTTASASHLSFWAARSRGAGYQPVFLLDTATGQFDRLPASRMRGLSFSKDGRRAVWIEGGRGELPVLVRRKLEAPGSTIRSSLDRYAGQDPILAQLSDDGRHAVLGMLGAIAVVDTDSGREAAAASAGQLGVDPRGAVQLARYVFVGDAVVAFFTSPPSAGLPLVTSSFDFRTGRVAPGPKVEAIDSIRSVRDGRALVSGRNGPLAVVDGSTVHELVPAANGVVVGSATLLEDGGAAAHVKKDGDPRLMIWNREGETTLDVPFPAGSSTVAGEPRAGWLALGAGMDFSKPPRTLFVDSRTGAVVRVEEGLTPIGGFFEDRNLPAGSPGSRLFVGTKGEIVRLDPETGRREPIFVSTAPEDGRYR